MSDAACRARFCANRARDRYRSPTFSRRSRRSHEQRMLVQQPRSLPRSDETSHGLRPDPLLAECAPSSNTARPSTKCIQRTACRRARRYHAAGPTEGGFLVVAVWESKAAADKFISETLLPDAAEHPGRHAGPAAGTHLRNGERSRQPDRPPLTPNPTTVRAAHVERGITDPPPARRRPCRTPAAHASSRRCARSPGIGCVIGGDRRE